MWCACHMPYIWHVVMPLDGTRPYKCLHALKDTQQILYIAEEICLFSHKNHKRLKTSWVPADNFIVQKLESSIVHAFSRRWPLNSKMTTVVYLRRLTIGTVHRKHKSNTKILTQHLLENNLDTSVKYKTKAHIHCMYTIYCIN